MLKYFFKITYQQFLSNQNSIEKEKNMMLCIIVLYVYMFCYVNKIIETISCLFSLN